MRKLRLITRGKIATVKAVASFFGIPITVHEQRLPEVIRRNIEEYLEESCYILEHVFNQPLKEVWKLDEWGYDFLMGNKESPFNLHDHPLYFAGLWMGVYPGCRECINELRAAEERHSKMAREDEVYKARFMTFCEPTSPSEPSPDIAADAR